MLIVDLFMYESYSHATSNVYFIQIKIYLNSYL